MSFIYCPVCRIGIVPGDTYCPMCMAGSMNHPRLRCLSCHSEVISGQSQCTCRSALSVADPPRPTVLLPPLAALPVRALTQPIPESYKVARFGVEAEVQLVPGDVEILTLMSQAVMALHALAQKMNQFRGSMDSTRRCISGCRNLATQLQEEIELRRGPQG
jgi:hypothetical protein